MNRVHQTSANGMIPAQNEQKISRQLILLASIISLIAIPSTYNMIKGSNCCNPSSDLGISTMTPEQSDNYCTKFVNDIKNIDGVPLQNINQFAKEHLAFGQRDLQEKLFHDCTNGKKMGITYNELADHLENIRSAGQFASRISYNPALYANSTIGKCSQTQSLQYGDDIISGNCMSVGTNIFNSSVKACWDPKIRNLHNNVYIRISDKIIARIREGFCDGFSPLEVMAILTGHSVASIKQAIGTVTQQDEINNVLSSIVVSKK